MNKIKRTQWSVPQNICSFWIFYQLGKNDMFLLNFHLAGWLGTVMKIFDSYFHIYNLNLCNHNNHERILKCIFSSNTLHTFHHPWIKYWLVPFLSSGKVRNRSADIWKGRYVKFHFQVRNTLMTKWPKTCFYKRQSFFEKLFWHVMKKKSKYFQLIKH